MKCSTMLNFIRYESTKKCIENRIDQLYDLYDILDNEEIKDEVMFKIRGLEHKLNRLKATTHI